MVSPTNRQPATPEDLRKFGYQIGGIFLFLGSVFLYSYLFREKGPILMVICLGLGVYLVSFAVIGPSKLAGFNRFWWKLSDFLGRYVGHYVGMSFFTLLYWILFAPVALIMRVVGFDPLGVRSHRKAATYWHDRPRALSSDHYERQFSVEKKDHE